MINQSPQAKLNQQVASNTQATNQQANQKSNLGNPQIQRPQATPVTGPQVEKEPEGFSEWISSKWKAGKEWAKDQAWNYAMAKGSESMQEMQNPPGQPGKGQPQSPGAPESPRSNVPKANTPQPGIPKLGATPRPRVPKPQIPKFRR